MYKRTLVVVDGFGSGGCIARSLSNNSTVFVLDDDDDDDNDDDDDDENKWNTTTKSRVAPK